MDSCPSYCRLNNRFDRAKQNRGITAKVLELLISHFYPIIQDPEKGKELDEKARRGDIVVPGGTGGHSLEAREHLAEDEKEQIGEEGYHEMGKKGGLSTSDKSRGERAAEEGIKIDESKYKTKNR
ncbi:unnamed protein product [Malus baccata var. baccata]